MKLMKHVEEETKKRKKKIDDDMQKEQGQDQKKKKRVKNKLSFAYRNKMEIEIVMEIHAQM